MLFPSALALDTIDTDNDGLSDHAELITYQSDRTNPDTDGDGISDGVEVHTHGTDPTSTDTDGDNLSDPAEINEYNTDPLWKYTDNDKLSDGDEVHIHGTDPTNPDTDGDGLSDYEEVTPEEIRLPSGMHIAFTSEPLVKDTDRDGVNDHTEIRRGLNVSNPDTDGDRLSDGLELNISRERQYAQLDPRNNDTDGDGHIDYYAHTPVSELESGIGRIHLNKPFDTTDFSGTDSDGDGFPDRVEQNNPNLSTDTKDIVVRVVWAEGQAPRTSSLLNIVDAYADSPVDNNNGIRLHFYIDRQLDTPDTVSATEMDYDEPRYDGIAETDTGMHNALYVNNVEQHWEAVGGFAPRGVPLIVVANANTHKHGSVTMHELGHSLGLDATIDGIDSEKYAVKDYPSVMNYNAECYSYEPACYMYSAGTGHDDWDLIEQLLEDGTTTATGSYRGH